MLYPILTVVCLLLRGHLSFQRKDTNISQSPNDLNTSINSCSIEELSKLLTDRIALNKALELSALKESKTKQELVENIIKLGTNGEKTHFDVNRETLSSKDNEIQKNIDYENIPTTKPKYPKPITAQAESKPNILGALPLNNERQMFTETNHWPIDSSYAYSFPLFFPHRNFKPPPGAKIRIQFKGKKREVTITVSPLMTVLEGLKQAEIKFKRMFKNIAVESDLISLWWSPTLHCILIDKVSSVENNKSMMWKISVIDSGGQIEFEDFCLPANGQVFIKPGSTIQLIYTTVHNVKDIY